MVTVFLPRHQIIESVARSIRAISTTASVSQYIDVEGAQHGLDQACWIGREYKARYTKKAPVVTPFDTNRKLATYSTIPKVRKANVCMKLAIAAWVKE
jgi:hypothetical protein